MSFTENFNYLKKKKGLSKYQIAQDLDCSQSSVKNWETGDVVPRDRSRNKIAKYFGITLAELDGDELPVLPEQGIKKAPDPKIEGVSDARQKLYDAIANLTDEQCTKLLGVVEWAKKNK